MSYLYVIYVWHIKTRFASGFTDGYKMHDFNNGAARRGLNVIAQITMYYYRGKTPESEKLGMKAASA